MYLPLIRRVARIWKRGGGGFFERVSKVQTTLTRIFIALESVSHGLSENSDEISRKAQKLKRFFRPKTGDLQKKKKKQVFTEIYNVINVTKYIIQQATQVLSHLVRDFYCWFN